MGLSGALAQFHCVYDRALSPQRCRAEYGGARVVFCAKVIATRANGGECTRWALVLCLATHALPGAPGGLLPPFRFCASLSQ